MTNRNIIARLTRIHNNLIAQSRAVKAIYDDLPLVSRYDLDSDMMETLDIVLAAAEKVMTVRSLFRLSDDAREE